MKKLEEIDKKHHLKIEIVVLITMILYIVMIMSLILYFEEYKTHYLIISILAFTIATLLKKLLRR
jgi:hypothetical protein